MKEIPFPQFAERNPLIPIYGDAWRPLIEEDTVSFVDLPVYANNAAAKAGGLTVGVLYRTNADPDLVCVVH
jgi:hypothetical protein